MAQLYLLDTNILIAALRGDAQVKSHLETTPLDALRLSSIVLGELAFGVEKSRYGQRNRTRLNALTERLLIVGVDAEVALHYGAIRHALEKQGTMIGANDLWIAAQTLSLGATLVTDNQGEFQRVPGLKSLNWIER